MDNSDKKKHIYKPQEKVRIVAGKYQQHKVGTFVRYAGCVSADVKISEDTALERCIRLTSIAPFPTKEEQYPTKEEEQYVMVSKTKICFAIEELESIPITDREVEMKLERLIEMMEDLLNEDDTDKGNLKKQGRWKPNKQFNNYKK